METLTVRVDFTVLDSIIRRAQGKPMRIVHDGVEYGIYQEFGTSRGIAPRPAAQTAAIEMEPAYQELMAQITEVPDPDAAIEKFATDLADRWKQNIIQMKIIDTSAYLNSVRVSTPAEWGGEE